MEAVPQHKDKLSLQPLKKEALTPDDAQDVESGLQRCRQDALSFFQVLITWGACLQEQRSKNAFPGMELLHHCWRNSDVNPECVGAGKGRWQCWRLGVGTGALGGWEKHQAGHRCARALGRPLVGH